MIVIWDCPSAFFTPNGMHVWERFRYSIVMLQPSLNYLSDTVIQRVFYTVLSRNAENPQDMIGTLHTRKYENEKVLRLIMQ
jgi:hypothetical protein